MISNSAPPVEIAALTKRFGRVRALDNLMLNLSPGTACALLGANGAGKSTLFRILIGALHPTSGQARVFGLPADRLPQEAYQNLGFVAEGMHMPDWMKAGTFLRYCRGLYPNWDAAFERRLLSLLDLDLAPKISELSRGMRMKLAVVSALAYRPALLLLDEPFAGLDVVVRDELIQALVELMQQESWTLLISSHEVYEMERLADRVALIDAGRLVLNEPIDDLTARFRRVRLSFAVPPSPSSTENHPPAWLKPKISDRWIDMIDTGFRPEESPAGYRRRFPDLDGWEASPMSLREIMICLRRARRETIAQEERGAL